jgi:hypothetical protein
VAEGDAKKGLVAMKKKPFFLSGTMCTPRQSFTPQLRHLILMVTGDTCSLAQLAGLTWGKLTALPALTGKIFLSLQLAAGGGGFWWGIAVTW